MKFNKEKDNLQNPQILSLEDDFSLIKRFIDGDETTFRMLVQRHKDKVRNITYSTLGSSDEVDDISQDVFITVYKNLHRFRFESQFSTWLYRITVNKCKDYLRKKKIRSIFLTVKEEDDEPTYNSIQENKDIVDIVRKAVQRLPDKLRIPLVLKDFEGMSYQEIAEIVNCELGTVKSRIFRAREGLREILKPFEKELML